MKEVKKMKRDTISALATGQGGAISIIRVSGNDAITITSKLFSKSLDDALPQTLHYGTIQDDDASIVDEVLVSVFRAPHSYTGENATEISCHASPYIVSRILQLLDAKGCRQAEPGEYTRRAFAHGKMDLSQAEAVADLIAARTAASHHVAMSQMRGGFSQKLHLLRERLLKLTSLMELELDFSDHEELEFADRSELRQLVEETRIELQTLANSFQLGNAIKNGIPVAIIGNTNTGKSTLLNALLHEERAIVSDIKGTTRDAIEDTININGTTLRFIDTAGMRETTDQIEQLGIQRSYDKLDHAQLVLWVVDAANFTADINTLGTQILSHCAGKHLILVLNKTDKLMQGSTNKSLTASAPQLPSTSVKLASYHTIPISAKTGAGMDHLRELLTTCIQVNAITENDVIVTNQRHYAALRKALTAIECVQQGMHEGLSTDLLSEDLHGCLDALSSILGEVSSQEVLNNIFSHFCIGK